MVSTARRNRDVRERCLQIHGVRCPICGFDFAATFSESFRKLIHAHHVTPFSECSEKRASDPVNDLRPVCLNCHAAIHSRRPAYSIEEVRDLYRKVD